MLIRLAVISLLIFCAASVYAAGNIPAADTLKSPRYFNSFHFGGLLGAKDVGTTATFATFHGIHFDKWRMGVGAGFDVYERWNFLQIYGMLSFDFAKVRKNRLYLTMAGGYSEPYRNGKNEVFNFDPSTGVTACPLVGYRIISGRWNINFQAGYKWQRVDYTYEPKYWLAIYTNPTTYEVQETMERVVVHIGFGLN